jgi:hypothetical protein
MKQIIITPANTMKHPELIVIAQPVVGSIVCLITVQRIQPYGQLFREIFSGARHGTLFNNRFRSFSDSRAIGLFCTA